MFVVSSYYTICCHGNSIIVILVHNGCRPSLPVALPGEVALRICAIREMFEESGVLLARERDQSREMMAYVPGSIPPAVMPMSEECASQWRNRVHINAQNFIAMCRFAGGGDGEFVRGIKFPFLFQVGVVLLKCHIHSFKIDTHGLSVILKKLDASMN